MNVEEQIDVSGFLWRRSGYSPAITLIEKSDPRLQWFRGVIQQCLHPAMSMSDGDLEAISLYLDQHVKSQRDHVLFCSYVSLVMLEEKEVPIGRDLFSLFNEDVGGAGGGGQSMPEEKSVSSLDTFEESPEVPAKVLTRKEIEHRVVKTLVFQKGVLPDEALVESENRECLGTIGFLRHESAPISEDMNVGRIFSIFSVHPDFLGMYEGILGKLYVPRLPVLQKDVELASIMGKYVTAVHRSVEHMKCEVSVSPPPGCPEDASLDNVEEKFQSWLREFRSELDAILEAVQEEFYNVFGRSLRSVIKNQERMDELEQRIGKLGADVAQVNFDPFDHERAHFWKSTMASFERERRVLLSQAKSFINYTFRDMRSSEAAFGILLKFSICPMNPMLRSVLNEKYADILTQYKREVTVIQGIFRDLQERPPVQRNLPPVAGAVVWVRHLLNSIRSPMQRFAAIPDLMQTDSGKLKDLLHSELEEIGTCISVGTLPKYNWLSLVIGEFLNHNESLLSGAKFLHAQLGYLTKEMENRVHALSNIDFLGLPEPNLSGKVPLCKDFFDDIQKRQVVAVQCALGHFSTISPLLNKIEGLLTGLSSGRAKRMMHFYEYWEDQIFRAFLTSLTRSLECFRESLLTSLPCFQVALVLSGTEILLRPSQAQKVPRWKKGTCLECRNIPGQPFRSFYDDIVLHPDIVSSVNDVKNDVVRVLQQLQVLCDKWRTYETLWKADKHKVISQFLRKIPTVMDYDSRLLLYATLREEAQRQPRISSLAAISVDVGPIIDAIDMYTMGWMQSFAIHLRESASSRIHAIHKDIEVLNSQLQGRASRSFEDLKVVLSTITQIRELNCNVERNLRDVDEMYYTLRSFHVLPKMILIQDIPEEEYQESEEVGEEWKQLFEDSRATEIRLARIKARFQRSTEEEVAAFILKCREFQAQFRTRGPSAYPQDLDQGIILLQPFQENLQKFEAERARLSSAQRLFDLPVTEYPEINEIGWELKDLCQIYALYIHHREALQTWSEFLWNEFDLSSILLPVEGLLKEMDNLPQSAREHPVGQELQGRLVEVCATLPLVIQLRTPALCPRHWLQLLAILGEDEASRSKVWQDLRLREVFSWGFHRHKDSILILIQSAEEESKVEAELHHINKFLMEVENESGILKRCQNERTGQTISKISSELEYFQRDLLRFLCLKRLDLPRLAFLSDHELLDLFGTTTTLAHFQYFVPKIFPGVAKLLGDDEVGITGMVGIGGEDILALSPVGMKGKAVEDWLPQLIHSMKESYWKEIKKAVYHYGCNKRMTEDWCKEHVTGAVLMAHSIWWTALIEHALNALAAERKRTKLNSKICIQGDRVAVKELLAKLDAETLSMKTWQLTSRRSSLLFFSALRCRELINFLLCSKAVLEPHLRREHLELWGLILEGIFPLDEEQAKEPQAEDEKARFQDLIFEVAKKLQICISSEQSPVLLAGKPGVGKSAIVLMHLDSVEAYSIIQCGIQGSIDTLRQCLDCSLEKQTKTTYGPPLGKQLTVFIKDLHLSQGEGEYERLASFISLLASSSSYYETSSGIQFKEMKKISFILTTDIDSLIPSSLLKNCFVIYVPPLLGSELEQVIDLPNPLPKATIELFTQLKQAYLTDSLLLSGPPNIYHILKLQTTLKSALYKNAVVEMQGRIWAHEVLRIFGGSFPDVSARDTIWDNLMKIVFKIFPPDVSELVLKEPIVFGYNEEKCLVSMDTLDPLRQRYMEKLKNTLPTIPPVILQSDLLVEKISHLERSLTLAKAEGMFPVVCIVSSDNTLLKISVEVRDEMKQGLNGIENFKASVAQVGSGLSNLQQEMESHLTVLQGCRRLGKMRKNLEEQEELLKEQEMYLESCRGASDKAALALDASVEQSLSELEQLTPSDVEQMSSEEPSKKYQGTLKALCVILKEADFGWQHGHVLVSQWHSLLPTLKQLKTLAMNLSQDAVSLARTYLKESEEENSGEKVEKKAFAALDSWVKTVLLCASSKTKIHDNSAQISAMEDNFNETRLERDKLKEDIKELEVEMETVNKKATEVSSEIQKLEERIAEQSQHLHMGQAMLEKLQHLQNRWEKECLEREEALQCVVGDSVFASDLKWYGALNGLEMEDRPLLAVLAALHLDGHGEMVNDEVLFLSHPIVEDEEEKSAQEEDEGLEGDEEESIQHPSWITRVKWEDMKKLRNLYPATLGSLLSMLTQEEGRWQEWLQKPSLVSLKEGIMEGAPWFHCLCLVKVLAPKQYLHATLEYSRHILGGSAPPLPSSPALECKSNGFMGTKKEVSGTYVVVNWIRFFLRQALVVVTTRAPRLEEEFIHLQEHLHPCLPQDHSGVNGKIADVAVFFHALLVNRGPYDKYAWSGKPKVRFHDAVVVQTLLQKFLKPDITPKDIDWDLIHWLLNWDSPPISQACKMLQFIFTVPALEILRMNQELVGQALRDPDERGCRLGECSNFLLNGSLPADFLKYWRDTKMTLEEFSARVLNCVKQLSAWACCIGPMGLSGCGWDQEEGRFTSALEDVLSSVPYLIVTLRESKTSFSPEEWVLIPLHLGNDGLEAEDGRRERSSILFGRVPVKCIVSHPSRWIPKNPRLFCLDSPRF
ncbi:unnamed protein product [Darwinula stevensoni]|uniref:Dynein heavy chain n=1 Tax=Darwinula stevensoni TaxID=69355 RepID=A0A7R8XFF2_9CRUS|nr:unnamed protein product [Darwinula stevensoni]CAG0890641.1 unnamed protein product [Darwinula stevensoni]